MSEKNKCEYWESTLTHLSVGGDLTIQERRDFAFSVQSELKSLKAERDRLREENRNLLMELHEPDSPEGKAYQSEVGKLQARCLELERLQKRSTAKDIIRAAEVSEELKTKSDSELIDLLIGMTGELTCLGAAQSIINETIDRIRMLTDLRAKLEEGEIEKPVITKSGPHGWTNNSIKHWRDKLASEKRKCRRAFKSGKYYEAANYLADLFERCEEIWKKAQLPAPAPEELDTDREDDGDDAWFHDPDMGAK